jgi:hypothetical protein
MATLATYTDVYDVAALAISSIETDLDACGLRLDPGSGEALRHGLEAILRLAQVELV